MPRLSCCRRCCACNGPAYLVARKRLDAAAAVNRTGDLAVWILSAKFDLLEAGDLIPDYDEKMTIERAAGRRAQILNRAQLLHCRRCFDKSPPEFVYVHLSRLYRSTLDDYLARLASCSAIEFAAGPPGVRLRQLGRWLDERNSRSSNRIQIK